MAKGARYLNVGTYDRSKVLDQEEATAKILTILAKTDEALNKNEILRALEKGVSKPRLYKIMDALELWRFVQVTDTSKARAPGCVSKHYKISESGMHRLLHLKPNLETKDLGDVARKITPKDFTQAREELYRVRADYFKSALFLSPLRKIMAEGKGPPNCKWSWILTTDSQGRPTLKSTVSRPRTRWKVIPTKVTREQEERRLLRANEESLKKLAKATKTRPEDWKQVDYARQ